MKPPISAPIIANVVIQVLALIDRCNRTDDGAGYSAADLDTTNAGPYQYSLCRCFRSVGVAAVYPTAGELQRTFVRVHE